MKRRVTKAIMEIASEQLYGNFIATMASVRIYHDVGDLQLYIIHNIAGRVNRFIISFSVKIKLR